MPAFAGKFASGHMMLPNGVTIPALTSFEISLITAVPTASCLVGMPLASWGADKFGRKMMVLVACSISLLGAALQTAASTLALFVVGRTVLNIPIIMFLTLATAWIAEVAPPEIRGMMASLSIVTIDLAAVFTTCVSYASSKLLTSAAYRIPVGLQLLWPLIIALGLLFIRDTPTFYLIKGREEYAESTLRNIRGGYTESEIHAEMDMLKSQKALKQEEVEVPWSELFKGTNLRRTLLSLSIANFQQLSGIAFSTNYATLFLSQIGSDVNPFVLTIGLAVLALAGAITGLFLVDRIGRRVLALTTFGALFVIDLVVGCLGFADVTNPAVPKAVAAFCLMFGFFFAAGFGPLTYVVAGEMPTARLRNRTSGLVFLVVASFSTVVVYVLPYISQPDKGNLGPKTYLIFAGWMALVSVITYLYLPETKGRSAAELDEMFEARVPARQFKGMCFSTPYTKAQLLT